MCFTQMNYNYCMNLYFFVILHRGALSFVASCIYCTYNKSGICLLIYLSARKQILSKATSCSLNDNMLK